MYLKKGKHTTSLKNRLRIVPLEKGERDEIYFEGRLNLRGERYVFKRDVMVCVKQM